MSEAEQIRNALARVAALRAQAIGQPPLQRALSAIKDFQSRRFAASYADLAADGVFGPATAFFLHELYGVRDFSERDGQFARIAGTLERTFPQDALRAAVDVARLHTISEELDHAMALAWQAALPRGDAAGAVVDALGYVTAWRTVGRRADRQLQLHTVLELGRALSHLTRNKALGWMLKVMRAPAQAAGLGHLQHFLSLGFDTFGTMNRRPNAADTFLRTIEEREGDWIAALFDDEPRLVQQRLARLMQGGTRAG